MKKIAFLLFFIGFIGGGLYAQTTVTGIVSDEEGGGIPGAIVKVKGMSAVAMTDYKGSYSINVPEAGKELVFTYTGKDTVTRKITGPEINVTLVSADHALTTVVVTGMGVKRDEKKVGYAVTSVGSEEVTKTKTSSALNALQGKIPGVNISSASGAAGASTRIVFRGFGSINGGNQPLFIVDGVPVSNASSGSSSLNGGTDFGNQANDINPEDIESMSFLKGSAATAIYGNRAANGVVIITTKNGSKAKKGLSVSVSSTLKFSSPLRLPQLQNVYGQGVYGNWDLFENTSYGPKFDGKPHFWGHVVDGERLIKPYEGLERNVADFFEVGVFMQNSVSIMGGGKSTNYRLSFSNTSDDGIMPYDKDSYNRNTISFNGGTKLSNKITAKSSFTYVNKKNKSVPTGQGGQSVYNNVLQQPRDIPIVELSDYKNKFFNNDNYYGNYTTNPYWPLLENGNENNEDRVYGMTQISYEITPKIVAMYRLGGDVSNRQLHEWKARKINDPKGFNAGRDPEEGMVGEYTVWRSQLNSDFIVTYTDKFGDDFSLNALAGHNVFQYKARSQYGSTKSIDIENFYNLSNSPLPPSTSEWHGMQRLVGVYGNVDLNYKGWLNLGMTARNDWSSTLPEKNNSFFYPGASLGFVFTDAFPFMKNIKKIFPYGKLRLSYGKTGNDADMYNVYPVFVRGGGRFPLPNNVNGYTLSDEAGSPNLQPEMTSEFEIGTDLRFVGGKYRIDFTYYNKKTDNLIFRSQKAATTGYTRQMSNLGEIANRGIELGVTVNPVSKKNFDLTFVGNFTINRSEIIRLGDGMEDYLLYGIGTDAKSTSWMLYPRSESRKHGSPIGMFEITATQKYIDKDGKEHIVVGPTGIPKTDPNANAEMGTSENDFMAGLSVDMKFFKTIGLSFSFDWHQGGLMYSRTAGMVYFTGIAPQTLYNDRQPFVVPNSVIQVGVDENKNPIYAENTQPVLYDVLGGSANSYFENGGNIIGRHELVSKTYVKLRDVAISFNMPKKWLNKTPFGAATFSVIGNNLLIWTPKSNNVIDPEMTTFGNDIYAEFGEFGATPTIRVIGFNLTLKF